jgi:hypothetical protein
MERRATIHAAAFRSVQGNSTPKIVPQNVLFSFTGGHVILAVCLRNLQRWDRNKANDNVWFMVENYYSIYESCLNVILSSFIVWRVLSSGI